ncbi:MAG: B12-binding domain-containing radical SAM protein [Vicinamibacteria bacterium]|nr:B12-binding domain-containing radical SAM protein [Vicinamibacteria bacterium]
MPTTEPNGRSLRVVLYNPRSNVASKRIVPFSLLAIGAVLEGEFEYEIVDGNATPDPDAVLRAALDAGVTVFGMTVMPGPQLEDAFERTRALKTAAPQAIVIWGGYFPTEHAEACLGGEWVDFAIRGHGEFTALSLLRALSSGRDPRAEGTPGLAFRRADGTVALGEVARVPDIEALPEFPFHRIEMAAYPRATFLGKRTLGYHSSYGCPFLCNFCGVVSLARGRWNAQSAARVERNLRRYRDEWEVDAVEFYDNNFFTHEERCADIAARIAPLGFSWWGEGRIDTLLKFKDKTWESMAKSGLRMIFLGAESGSAEALARMDKGGVLTPQMTLELAARMRAFGVVPEFSFVLGNPPDPAADIECTLTFVKQVKEKHPEAEIILYQYTPVPVAGELLEAASGKGFAFPKTLDEWTSPSWREVSRRRSDRLPWIDAGQRRRIRNFERVLNAYHPTSTDPTLTGWRRAVLRAASGWRYRLSVYEAPYELRALQKLFRYQRPETAGF